VSENYLAWGLGYAGREQGELDRVFPLAYQDSSPTLGELDLERRRLLDLGLDADKLLCCYFGQFEATYDLETVVAAARILKDDGAADVQFVLCGDGSKMTALSELAAGLDNVILLGWVSPLTISAVMSMADIGLAPYAKGAPQGIPNKPIEYFCGGLLVLSSLRGELDDVITVHNCGMVYEAGDAQGLAQAVQGLRDHPRERQSMKGNARRLFERSFSAERVYGDMIAYLEGLVDVN
jgi:glycosyltransferase involved in cell wall biosynthesis